MKTIGLKFWTKFDTFKSSNIAILILCFISYIYAIESAYSSRLSYWGNPGTVTTSIGVITSCLLIAPTVRQPFPSKSYRRMCCSLPWINRTNHFICLAQNLSCSLHTGYRSDLPTFMIFWETLLYGQHIGFCKVLRHCGPHRFQVVLPTVKQPESTVENFGSNRRRTAGAGRPEENI